MNQKNKPKIIPTPKTTGLSLNHLKMYDFRRSKPFPHKVKAI